MKKTLSFIAFIIGILFITAQADYQKIRIFYKNNEVRKMDVLCIVQFDINHRLFYFNRNIMDDRTRKENGYCDFEIIGNV